MLRPFFWGVGAVTLWDELWIATALLLVMEGVVPFMSPVAMRRALVMMAAMDDRTMRITGLVSMVLGVVILYIVH